jgi:hypothetical protein
MGFVSSFQESLAKSMAKELRPILDAGITALREELDPNDLNYMNSDQLRDLFVKAVLAQAKIKGSYCQACVRWHVLSRGGSLLGSPFPHRGLFSKLRRSPSGDPVFT